MKNAIPFKGLTIFREKWNLRKYVTQKSCLEYQESDCKTLGSREVSRLCLIFFHGKWNAKRKKFRSSERTCMKSYWHYTLRERWSRSRDEKWSRTGCGDATAITSCWPLLTRHSIKKWTRNGTVELPSVSLITAIFTL